MKLTSEAIGIIKNAERINRMSEDHNLWFAVQNEAYSDWDDGSEDFETAFRMAEAQCEEHTDVKIAYIDDAGKVCIGRLILKENGEEVNFY